MSSFLNDTRIKRWMKIGAKEAVIEDLIITDTLILPGDIILTDITIANQTNVGEVNIGCLDNSSFNLQTATNGNDGEVLKTDGNGICYWGTGNTPGGGIVFNGTTPIAEPGHHTTISVDGLGLNLSKLIENTTELNMGALDIKNANVITCFDVQTDDYFSLNQELQKIENFEEADTGLTKVVGTIEADSVSANYVFNKDNGSNFIEMPNNQDAIKVYTTDFLFNGEQVATINDIPPSNPFNQNLNTSDNAIFSNVSSYDESGVLQFSQLYPKSIQDLNIGTLNTDILRLGGEGVFIDNGNLVGVNNVSSTRISADLLYPKTLLTSFIDLSVDENIKVNTSNFLLNGIQIATIDDIPAQQTFQDVYNSSPTPALITLLDLKNIRYEGEDGTGLVMEIDGDFGVVRMPIIETNTIRKQNASLDNILVEGVGLTANNFTKQGGTSSQYLMADGSTTTATSPATFQDIYDNSANPVNVSLVNNKSINFINSSSVVAFKILATGANVRVEGDNARFENLATQTLAPLSGDVIDILGNTAMKTDRTIFTENQEFITKSYVDTNVGAITLTTTGTGAPILNDNTNPSFSFRSLKSSTGNDRIDITITGTGGSEITLTNPNPASAIAITSTDNNLLGVVNTNPTFSLTPKYTYMMTFAGNNTTTNTAQWFIPSTLRSSTTSATQSITNQLVVPINSVIAWMGVSRTNFAVQNSIGISVNAGVPTTFIYGAAASDIFKQFAVNISVVAGQPIATSIFSTSPGTAGNCLITLLLRGA